MNAPLKDVHVRSRSGKVHQQRETSALTLCGLPFVDLFASYEAGSMWPRVESPVSCKSCLRSPAADTRVREWTPSYYAEYDRVWVATTGEWVPIKTASG